MQESTASPSAAVQSTDNDCIASQPNPIKQTTAQTHTLICGRAGRPVVFVYEVGTDWLTVSCLTNDHSSVCKGGFYGLREKGRIKELENDEYTEDVRPISVRCRGCQKAISLDKRSGYYPGLWVRHRAGCPGILKIETYKKLTRRRDWSYPSNPERRPPAASSFAFDASSEESDEDEYEGEYEVMGFSTSDVQFFHDCWERGER